MKMYGSGLVKGKLRATHRYRSVYLFVYMLILEKLFEFTSEMASIYIGKALEPALVIRKN